MTTRSWVRADDGNCQHTHTMSRDANQKKREKKGWGETAKGKAKRDLGSKGPVEELSPALIAPAENEVDVFERKNNRAIVLLFKVCAELEVMTQVFEGLDDDHFLDRIRGLYGPLFSKF